ncbi:CBS domain-containing protein [bacterium]|nr:CBS domain-containing protein [bacterium]
MVKNFFIAEKKESLQSIMQKIVINGHRGVIVVEKKKVLGIITEGDILKSLVDNKIINSFAENIMNKSFKFLKKKDMKKAKEIFASHLCSFIPVVNDQMELKDLITLKQILSK